jgi:hypothetical protein
MLSILFLYSATLPHPIAHQFHNCVFSDGHLNLNEFRSVCRALFRNDKGKIYSMEEKKLQDILSVFDRNKVCKYCVMNSCYVFGRMCKKEVSVMWLVYFFFL